MKEICIPFTGIDDNDPVEVVVRNCRNNEEWLYKVESLKFEESTAIQNNKTSRVDRLLSYIRNYDLRWELLNIFNTEKPDGCIHLLYRKQHTGNQL
jgi:hypothetical protein